MGVFESRGADNEQNALELFETVLSKIMRFKDAKSRHIRKGSCLLRSRTMGSCH
jgi:hypothetical protein